jgi:cell division protein FtsW
LTKARVIDAPKKVKPPKEKQPMDLPLLVLVFLLLVSGLIALFSASYATAYYNEGNSFAFISRQLLWAAIGVVFMLIISKIPYQIFHRLALPIMVLSIALLVVVLFMPPINGCRRWIFIGNVLNLQPSEIAKFAITIFFAQLIVVFGEEKMKTFRFGVLPFMITLGIVGALMVLEPHLSGTILIMCIGLAIMLVGGTRIKWFAILGGIVVAAVIVVIFTPDLIAYAKDRIDFWLHPENDPLGKGFQTLQSLYAIGSGGLLGLGLGNSRQKYMYLPESENDFVFAVWCEELGFVGAALVIILFALLIWRGFVVAMKAKDKFASLIAVGLTVQIGLQALLNIAVVTNTIPNTGISLPFFSYGGTSLFMLLAQMGVLLSISRHANIEKT